MEHYFTFPYTALNHSLVTVKNIYSTNSNNKGLVRTMAV